MEKKKKNNLSSAESDSAEAPASSEEKTAQDAQNSAENITNSELNDILDQNQDDSDDENDDEELAQKPDYEKEIIDIIRGNASPKYMRDRLDDYHENDIAEVLSKLTVDERKKLYRVLTKFLNIPMKMTQAFT